MQVARDAVELGRAARAQAKVKVRQPLAEAVVVAPGAERAAIERFEALVLDELNVKRLRYVSEADELGRFELKPNYRALGPRFGKHMPQVAAAVAALDAAARPRHPARGRRGGRSASTAREHALDADDVQLVLQPLEGYQLERAGTHAVALNLELDDDAAAARAWRARWSTPCRRRARTAGLRGGGPDLADARRRAEPVLEAVARARGLRDRRDAGRRAAYDGAAAGAATGRRPRAHDRGRAGLGRRPPASASALQLAPHRPVPLLGVLEADPDVLGLGLADLDQQVGERPASSAFCSAVRPSYHSMVTIGTGAAPA